MKEGHIQDFDEYVAKTNTERMAYAMQAISGLGYEVVQVDGKTLRFTFKGATVTLFPYKGWFSGKTVRDGRGIHNLLKQLKLKQ